METENQNSPGLLPVSAPAPRALGGAPAKLSYSSLSLYKDCPQRFKFRYVDGIKESPKSYFSFGQSVHKALEFFYRSQLIPPSLEELLRHYEEHWVKEGYATPGDEKTKFLEGCGIVKSYYQKHIPDWSPSFATEYSFNVMIDEIAITGKIDRIDKSRDGGLHVIDYKTGKSFASWRVQQDQQLTLYQLACEKAFGLSVERLTLYHLPTLTPVGCDRHADSLVRSFRRDVIAVRTAIDKGRFEPKPEEWKCRRCDYRPICPAWAQRAEEGKSGRVEEKTTDNSGSISVENPEEKNKTAVIANNRIKNHGELAVYRQAFSAAMQIFELSKSFPPIEKYSLTDQIRRSSRSVCANLAEAWSKRRYEASFINKLTDSEGEAAESQTWIEFAMTCGYINEEVAKKLLSQYQHVIARLIIMKTNPQDWKL